MWDKLVGGCSKCLNGGYFFRWQFRRKREFRFARPSKLRKGFSAVPRNEKFGELKLDSECLVLKGLRSAEVEFRIHNHHLQCCQEFFIMLLRFINGNDYLKLEWMLEKVYQTLVITEVVDSGSPEQQKTFLTLVWKGCLSGASAFWFKHHIVLAFFSFPNSHSENPWFRLIATGHLEHQPVDLFASNVSQGQLKSWRQS